MKQTSLFTLILVISALLSACGGSGGGGATPVAAPTKWTGTKQLGVGNAITAAESIAVDSNYNVYVAGSTNGALDGIALSGTGSTDLFLTVYNSLGTKLRTKLLGVSGKITTANSVTVDLNGNIYVVGSTNGGLDGNTLTGIQDFFLTMYDSSGNKIRTKQLGVSLKSTVANAVAVDANGNVYVAGYTTGGLDGNTVTGNQDLFLTMYNSSGNKIRTSQLGVASLSTTATSIAIDAYYNVYVVGYTNGGLDGNTLTGLQDFFVTTYNSVGAKIRTNQLGVTGYPTAATGVAVDTTNGNVNVVGYTNGGLDGNTLVGQQDLFVTTYDLAGYKLRTKQLGVAATYTKSNSIAVDTSGNAYIAGSTTGGLDGNTLMGLQDFFLTKYDSTGTKVRTKQLGVSTKHTVANGVAVDINGNAFVTGFTDGGLNGNTLAGTKDFFITKYDPSGVKQ
jgi:hypothetical protein